MLRLQHLLSMLSCHSRWYVWFTFNFIYLLYASRGTVGSLEDFAALDRWESLDKERHGSFFPTGVF